LCGLTSDLSVENILINLDVAIKNGSSLKIKNAGVLFFAKDPLKFIKNPNVVCVEYQTNEKVNILDRKIFNEGVIGNIEQSINFVKKHIDTKFEIKSISRKEIMQFPEVVFREAIVNAILHRDYFDCSGDIMVEVFKNKLIISNPGGLVKWLSPQDFGKYSRCRNSLISLLLSRTEYVEKMGTGINRMKEEMYNNKLPLPEFEFDEYNFLIKLYDNVTNDLIDNVIDNVTNNRKEHILKIIKDNAELSTEQIAERLKVTKRTILRDIEELKKENIVKRVGSAKNGHWEMVETKKRNVTNDVIDNVIDNVTNDVTDNVTNNRKEHILKIIKDNAELSTEQIAERLKVTKRTILRDIEELKKENIVKRVGSAKMGYWEMIEKK
jgi:ATP-dependent DNA helicase RecG